MMALINAIHASNRNELFKDWWRIVLVGLIVFSIALGIAYQFYLLYHLYRGFRKKHRKNSKAVPLNVRDCFLKASSSFCHSRIEKKFEKPENFGIYLGELETPPTTHQIRILSEWHLLIIDPSCPGILEAFSAGLYSLSPQILARLDLELIAEQSISTQIVTLTEWITKNIHLPCKSARNQPCFTGVSICNWEENCTILFLKEFIRFLSSQGLSVFLELSPPGFLSEPELAELQEVSGLVIRNGTICQNGAEKDAFQMNSMRSTIKAFVSQACLRKFVVLLWETIDHGAQPSNAVVRRCYQWSKFYNALPWIGSRLALEAAELSLAQKEPLGAFDWLKKVEVMEIHKKWSRNQSIPLRYCDENITALVDLCTTFSIPQDLMDSLTKVNKNDERSSLMGNSLRYGTHQSLSSQAPSIPETTLFTIEPLEFGSLDFATWLFPWKESDCHTISISPTGTSFDYLSCFPLGINVTEEAFADILHIQDKLRKKKLLDEIEHTRLQNIGLKFQQFFNYLDRQGIDSSQGWPITIKKLAHQLLKSSEDSLGSILVFLGLHSGFQTKPELYFWSVYKFDDNGILYIYISRNAHLNIEEVILHTFLSYHGYTRRERFQAELAFAEWCNTLVHPQYLTKRIIDDIGRLTPTELVRFLQSLSFASSSSEFNLERTIKTAIEMKLLDSTDFLQLRKMNTCGYLSGQVSVKDLIYARIKWYNETGCQHPNQIRAIEIFNQIDISITEILRHRKLFELARLTKNLAQLQNQDKTDARIDLIYLSVFCAMRKHAFDEAYIEVTDRNALLNDQSDQAAAFAELFVTGARCEAYLDMTPSAFGKLLSDRFRIHHHQDGNEPPIWVNADSKIPLVYSSAKIDVSPESDRRKMPAVQKLTFLSVFVIPALLDTLMLTTTGRGLYLSEYMSHEEQRSATLALMISLLISGVVGTWITCGGSYYLVSMAFSAMNSFVVTRLIGGLGLTLIIAVIGCIFLSIAQTISAGIIFFLYVVVLTSYLCLFSTICNYQYPNSSFQSGRPLILMLVPFLFISPIISTWIPDYDIFIYLTVFYAILIALVFATRHIGSKWATWLYQIETISDKTLKKWYINRYLEGNQKFVSNMTELGLLKTARDAMIQDVDSARNSYLKRTDDALVKMLAKSYDSAMFLLEWYSNYSNTPLPIPFSSTWNIQIKVALQTLGQFQTGMKLHNAFIHWRQAGDEIGCNFLYFIVALLDKWNAMISGNHVLSLSSTNNQFKLPTGFALAYYLIGAVILDFNAAKLHFMITQGHNASIKDASSLPEAVDCEVQSRRFLYWKMLGRYFLFHIWSLAISCSLLWLFQSTEKSTMLFFAYVGAYTGLLWYQYTRIFTGPRGLKPLIFAIALGIPVGQLIRKFLPNFLYGDVIGLATATWTAAILSLWFARIKTKSANFKLSKMAGVSPVISQAGVDEIYHAFTSPGKDSLLSQEELSVIFRILLSEELYRVNIKAYPGVKIRSIILYTIGMCQDLSENMPSFVFEAFPDAKNLLEMVIIALEREDIIIDCVPKKAMADSLISVKAISLFKDNKIRLIFGYDFLKMNEQQAMNDEFYQVVAEVALHIVAENLMKISHEDSLLIESLFYPRSMIQDPSYFQSLSWNENYLQSLTCLSEKKTELVLFYENQALRCLSLRFDLDLQWEYLPREIRTLLIKRCTGQETALTRPQHEWLISNHTNGISIQTFLARCKFGAYMAMLNKSHILSVRDESSDEQFSSQDTLRSLASVKVIPKTQGLEILHYINYPFSSIYHNIGFCLKILAICFVVDPGLQRELDYTLKNSNKIKRLVTMFILTGIWNYSKWLQDILMPFFLLHRRTSILKLWRHIEGTSVSLKRHKIVLEHTDGNSTGFILPKSTDGTFKVHMYSGDLDRVPDDIRKLQNISTYDFKTMNLLQLDEYSQAFKVNTYEYEYSMEPAARRKLSKTKINRYPIRRRCVAGKNEQEDINFNHRGLIESGSHILHGDIIRFKFYYRKGSNYDDELLRADYLLPQFKCSVSWSVPPEDHSENLENWIPHSQVMWAAFIIDSDVYESHWIYNHKFHPTIYTTLNGQPVETPATIQQDHLEILKKPQKCGFHHDDPLINFKSLRPYLFLRLMGLHNHQNRISTSSARSRLWNAWKSLPEFDGVIVRWLDEKLLRKDKTLRTYWRLRDRGDLIGAKIFLNKNAGSVMAAVDLDSSISSWAPLAIKIPDLHSFGQGGDANSRVRSKNLNFDSNKLQVLAVDSGTWPNEGGGVSACRRDMINNLCSVNWYMISESANDFGLPKHQTEMNVHSLKIIPLWGLDFLTPTHGLFEDRLDTEVEHLPCHATKIDVKWNFLPILHTLVKGARTINLTHSDVVQNTRALVKLNAYFSEGKHWSAVWTSSTVKDAWRNLWTSPDLVSPTLSRNWFQTEIPTIAQLDTALELWFRYLFIFSIPLPERIPAIFQASHHSVSAAYGIVCKIKRNCILQIWDHAISWREANLYLSSDLCALSPFIRNSLLGLMRITSLLILHHADIILPCADFFNPEWEIEIGTGQGSIEHRNYFKRKIDPVVNGITNMNKFTSIKSAKSERPTVTMLSHIWYAKDIKTAILAADIIVNEWGIKDYRLEIYGAIDKSPSYSMDCFELIASKSLSGFVSLCGESDPLIVLDKTWVFLNSSISEGLPLALGEAALTGAPVVCTDVGASLRVFTDPDTGEIYSAIVAPNDAQGLARAQINLLAMLDEWASYANDPTDFVAPTLSDKPTSLEIKNITSRMYEKKEERKALGVRCRSIVKKSFGGERYLREHEQMLWIGKARYDLRIKGASIKR